MSKETKQQKASVRAPSISKDTYKEGMRKLQIELVKLQRHFIKCDDKILIILEGRDASGKDGTIKRVVQKLLKYYLDISKSEQKERLEDRKSDPLKQWKVSSIDDQAIKRWKAYSVARNEMLARTHNKVAPWTLVRANDKYLARLNIIKDLLGRLHYTGKDKRLIRPDRQIVFAYEGSNPEHSQLAK